MSRNRQVIDHINPVCGQRLRLLLQEFKILQKEFAIMVNQDPSYICRLVNGRQRLSPDTARFYIKTAFEGKGIRWEWLAGLDDFKSEDDVRVYEHGRQIFNTFQDTFDFLRRKGFLESILEEINYSMYPSEFTEEEKQSQDDEKELYRFKQTVCSNKKTFTDYFTLEGWREIQDLCTYHAVDDISDVMKTKMDVYRDMFDDPISEAKYLNKKACEDFYKESYTMYNGSGDIEAQFTGQEIKSLADALHDVVTALIQYHINKKKGQS